MNKEKLIKSLMKLYKTNNEIIIDEEGHLHGSLDEDYLIVFDFIFKQTEIPTEEQVKQEWEELGYKWIKHKNGDILVINKLTDITFKQCTKEVLLGDIYEGCVFLTMKEITLIDKTRKMLRWFNG